MKAGDDGSGPLLQSKRFKIKGVFFVEASRDFRRLFRRFFFNRETDISMLSGVAEPIYLQTNLREHFYSATIKIDSVRNLKPVLAKVEALGLDGISALPILEGVKRQIARMSWLFYGAAAVVLLIAAIGISNTLIISVLERTPEFGIMKSLGARDRQVMGLMIGEGAILGVVGGILTFAISLILAMASNQLLRHYIERRIGQELPATLFEFSWQAVLAVTAILTLVCIVASLLPAFRAARLDPVKAMRRD